MVLLNRANLCSMIVMVNTFFRMKMKMEMLLMWINLVMRLYFNMMNLVTEVFMRYK